MRDPTQLPGFRWQEGMMVFKSQEMPRRLTAGDAHLLNHHNCYVELFVLHVDYVTGAILFNQLCDWADSISAFEFKPSVSKLYGRTESPPACSFEVKDIYGAALGEGGTLGEAVIDYWQAVVRNQEVDDAE